MPIIDYAARAEQQKKVFEADNLITQNNKQDLAHYLDSLNVSPARTGIIYQHIKVLFHEMPDVVGKMTDRNLVNATFKELAKRYKGAYLNTIKSVGKAFIRWHNDCETPRGWRDIKGYGKKSQMRNLTPEDMLTWDDGLQMAATTHSVQLKAVIMTQLDAGLRPSELIDLNYSDVTIKQTMAVISIKKGKTGKRDVIVLKCVPHLQRWLKEHPTKEGKDPLWIIEFRNKSPLKNMRYDYHALKKRIKGMAISAKIIKPVDFYALRHSACYLSKLQNITADLAACNFGHSVRHYTETYGRLSSEDNLRRYKKHYRLETDGAEITESQPTLCTRCNTINDAKIEICTQCANPLTMSAALKMGNENQKLREDMVGILARLFTLEQAKDETFRRRQLSGTISPTKPKVSSTA